jgi:lipopolysaccharide transport system ATP-binding protein
MPEPIIRVENLGKKYQIKHKEGRQGYKALRDVLADSAKTVFNLFKPKSGTKSSSTEEFWALKDVSFDIQQGDVVGIIGRNGAGKSTLLKILSRITEPSTGRVTLSGRVASLLEVGTGFHPELTGRENIYLNGSILGMSRSEIARKFDEIVAFAEVEKFLDTPVKRYSSGMYVRLAFAVAAHLEPEILVVDEVLAVGDAQFQKKCLGKMGEVAKGGRTVIYVSHAMQTVTRLCNRGVLLDEGRIKANGVIDTVVRDYLSSGESTPAHQSWPNGNGPGDEVVQLRSVRVRDIPGSTVHAVDIRKPIAVELEFEVHANGHQLVPYIHLYNSDGVCVFCASDRSEFDRQPRGKGRYRSTVWVTGNSLSEGTFSILVAVSTIEPTFVVRIKETNAAAFEVIDTTDGDSVRGRYSGPYPGVVRPDLKWSSERLPD